MPLILGCTIRIGKIKVATLIVDVFTAVIRPIVIHYQVTVSKLMRIRILKQADLALVSSWEKVCAKIERQEKELNKQTRLQLGLETIFQLAGNVVLFFTNQNHSRTCRFV